MRPTLALFTALFALTHCTNSNNVNTKDANAENLFYDYQMIAEEGADSVTLLIQFRPGNAEGDAVDFAGGSIKLDGRPLALDSAPNGTRFYEAVAPARGFAGNHTISVTNANGKTHEQKFVFMPLTLTQELGETVKKQPFTIRVKGASPASLVRLIVTDTSFTSQGINEELYIRGDSLHLSEAMLAGLVAGPVVLHLQAETEQPVQGNNKRGGRVLITCSLRREFELVEP